MRRLIGWLSGTDEDEADHRLVVPLCRLVNVSFGFQKQSARPDRRDVARI